MWYLAILALDITYTVHWLSQFLSEPRESHLKAAHRVLQYVKGSPGKELFIPTKLDLQVKAFCDANWAGC